MSFQLVTQVARKEKIRVLSIGVERYQSTDAVPPNLQETGGS